MREVFWKLVGADCVILAQSARRSQDNFMMLGILYAFLATITFISFFGFFLGVFDSFFMSLLGASVFSFIISNLYRLVIITLEPVTLPAVSDPKTKFWAYFVRVSIVILLAMFVSKVIETMLFGHWVDDIVKNKVIEEAGEYYYNHLDITKSKYFARHMIELNLKYPMVHVMTFFLVSLYVLPIIIKHRLKKGREYYKLKRKIDRRIVLEEYEKMLIVKASLLEDVCFKNDRPYRYQKLYFDEPFNTKRIPKEKTNSKSHEDFLTLFD